MNDFTLSASAVLPDLSPVDLINDLLHGSSGASTLKGLYNQDGGRNVVLVEQHASLRAVHPQEPPNAALAVDQKRGSELLQPEPSGVDAPEGMHNRNGPQSTSGGTASHPARGRVDIEPTTLPILYRISTDFVMFAGAGRAVAYHIASGDQLGKEGFVQYCSKHYGDIAVTNAEGNLQSMASGACWWNWNDASKRTVRRIVMEPTNVPEDHPEADPTVFNRWYHLRKEMATPDPDATLSSIKPLVEHLMFISDNDEVGVLYFLNWLAQLWRFPETKIPTAIMLYSKRTRMGKSMLAKLLANVFGPSMVTSCDGQVLHKNFMDTMEHQRVVVLNELARSDRQDGYERFKSLVSEGTMAFEGKGRASRNIRNITHFIITTNNADALPLMDNDGRFLVLRCESERRPNEYYAKMAGWFENEGPELLAGVLEQWKFPVSWDAYAPAPQTSSTVKTQLESKSPLHLFLKELINEHRPPFDRDLGRCTSLIEQLLTLYPGNVKGLRLNTRTLPATLSDLGAQQLGADNEKQACRKAWCWRRQDVWATKTPKAWDEHINSGAPPVELVTANDVADEGHNHG